MFFRTLFPLISAFVFSLYGALCLTPELDIHAVVITSEYIKPHLTCEEEENESRGFSFSRVNTTQRLMDLRRVMERQNISAYIVLSSDDHQSETVSEHDKRLKFISGFSGSNGYAAITLESAALWTDSRYYLQAEEEVDCNWSVKRMGTPGTPTLTDWLSTQVKSGESVSTDPKICGYEKWLNWEKNLSSFGIQMKLIRDNLIDDVWITDRPLQRNKPIFPLGIKFTGLHWEEKMELIRKEMKKAQVNAFVMTALDEIAWTLNLRGRDIPYFPVFHSYFIIEMKNATLYLREGKTTKEVMEHLNSTSTNQVPGTLLELKHYRDFWVDLPNLAKKYPKVGLPSKYSYFSGISYLLYYSIPSEKRVLMTSPALLLKDIKNPVEVKGMKACHIRDGVVVSRFLAQLEEEVTAGSTNWTELRAVEVLNDMRRKALYNTGLSFGTIAAFGKNAANAHYEPSKTSNAVIDTSQVFMLDSGGQYYDGTTDCTRTVHFGTPRDIEREIYTRLLIGCINLVTTVFKDGYTLKQLEIIIRAPLYELGLDYGHGSTHGIGSFLAVHESFNSTYHRNFFGSQEPGYYKENDFGMRLENIVTVVKATSTTKDSTGTYLTFEPVTLIPYEMKLIKVELLERKHINWLNSYHDKVRTLVGGEMIKQGLQKEYNWLLMKTEPIPY